jgi:hypothetical protein
MCRRRSRFTEVALCILAALWVPAACGFISLRDLGVQTYPSRKDAVVGTVDPVWVEFSEPVDRAAAEGLFKVQNVEGSVRGDLQWSDNRLLFLPLSPWVPGTRYVLRFAGSIETVDAGRYGLNIIIPFYGGSRDAPPRLLSFLPLPEAVVGVESALSFTFSAPMNTALFEEHFALSPDADTTLSWDGDQTVCTVLPDTCWQGLTRYTWTIPTKVESELCVPLAEEYRSHFRVIEDTSPPTLRSFRGAIWDDGGGGYVLFDPAFLDNEMALWFEFTKEMDWGSWPRAFSIEPATPALTTYVSSRVVLVDPQESWIPEGDYQVKISTDLSDTHANRLAAGITISFTPDVPEQRLTQIQNAPPNPTAVFTPDDWAAGNPLEIQIEVGTREHTFALQFAQPYQPSDIERLIDAIILDCTYPPTVSDPSLISVTFEEVSPQTLFLTYGGFEEPPSSAVRHFYRFAVPADRTATANARGSYFTEPVTVYFEVVAP